ncbi:hypothetical protein SFC43_11990 [Bacteroides sp. CR5/BHMF/2]|nr:hypothetical protein [Bacteroides sp. CR5/BHMF/2]
MIQNGVVVHTISFEGALSGVAKAFDENLWVSCTSPASIIKINPVDYTIIDSHQLDVSIGAGWELLLPFLRKMILFILAMPALSYIGIFSLKIRQKRLLI